MGQQQNVYLQIGSKPFIYLISFSITCGSFVMGYALVGTALLQDYISLVNNIKITQMDFFLSIIITLLPLGAIVGSLFSKKLINRIGQRNSMIFVDVIMLIGILLQTYSLQLLYMYISRFLFGIFCGISSSIIPSYLTSISPLQMTGIIGSLNQLMITVGICVAYGMQFFLSSNMYKKQTQVMIFILLPAIFCLIRIIILLVVFPFDTIERHYKKQQIEKVNQIINQIYINPRIEDYIRIKNITNQNQSIDNKIINKNNIKSQQQQQQCSSKNRIFLLSIILAIGNQLCGINAIFFYAKQLFNSLTNNNQQQVQIDLLQLGLFQVIITYFSGLFLDKYGRRYLMLLGQSIIVFSLIGSYIALDILNLSSNVIVLFVFLHILGFSISLGPISVLYVSEIMEDISVMIILLWVLTLIVSLVSDFMINQLGIAKTFLIFGIISLLCLIYLYKQMLQTKGLNRKQIQKMFQGKCTTFKLLSNEEIQQMEQILSNDLPSNQLEIDN